MKLKALLKEKIQSVPCLWIRYRKIKTYLKHVWMLRYYFYDIKNTFKYSKWGVNGSDNAHALMAEVIFNSHKLEKGLCLSNGKRIFAVEPTQRLIYLLTKWRRSSLPGLDEQIFTASLRILKDYKDHLIANNLYPEYLLNEIESFIARSTKVDAIEALPQTPYKVDLDNNWSELSSSFERLVQLRRSVRDFSDVIVPADKIAQAITLAQMSPSACNRQPCKVHILQNSELVQQVLLHQNGNRGFNEKISTIAIVTADIAGYFDASERNQGYVDGGLFLMTFLYGLQAQGISSCCLNWCVTPKTDIKVHTLFDIEMKEKIISLVAIGYANENARIAMSFRCSTESVIKSH